MTCRPCKSEPQLRVRVTIERRKTNPTTNDRDEVNWDDDTNWQSVGTRAAAVRTRFGSERFADFQEQSGHGIEIRLRSDSTTRAIDPTYRLRMGTRLFHIESAIDENLARQWVVIQAVEKRT